MKKFDIRNIRFKKVSIDQIDDRLLLINLYAVLRPLHLLSVWSGYYFSTEILFSCFLRQNR